MNTSNSNQDDQCPKTERAAEFELEPAGKLPHKDRRVVQSEELFRGQRELTILHGSQIYRLMKTRNGKLILQK